MAFFRSHWVRTTDMGSVERKVREWERKHATNVPGYEGVWVTNDLDDPTFWYVTLQCSSLEAFLGDGLERIQRLTGGIGDLLEHPVEHMDTEDIAHHEAEGWPTGPSKVYRSVAFRVSEPQLVQATVEAWVLDRFEKVPGFEIFWLVRGRSEPEWHSVSGQFSSRIELEEHGILAFDDLLDQLSGIVKGEVETRNVTGGIRLHARD